MSRNILCVLEFDNYPELVIDRAIWIAKSCNCDLRLLVCDPVTDLLGESFVYLLQSQDIAESINESRDEAVKSLAAKAEATGLNVEVNFSTERSVSDVVRRAADAIEPLYVVKGTHFHSPSERATLMT